MYISNFNIEKLFCVDIDAEFERDQCESLYNKIQQVRKAPEQIGKNEHDVRIYASRLKKYIEFRESENSEKLKADDRFSVTTLEIDEGE